jgi:MFS transporter, DHA1 family, inner membrane transport protein
VSPARAALAVLALWAAGLGAAAQFGKIGVIFDDLVAIYGSAPAVALMVSIVGMVGLVFGTTAGIVVQRLGLRRVIVAALLLGAALSAVQALLPPLPVMLATRVLEGLSHLAVVVVGPVMIAQAAPQQWQGLAMTLWSSFFGVSFAVLALVAPMLVAAAGIGGLFLAHAAVMAGLALLLALLLPDSPRGAPVAVSVPALWRQHGMIYRSPRIAAPAMGFFCYTILYVALLTLLPPLMGGFRPHAAAAMPLVSIAVSLTLGVWHLRRMTAVRLVQAGFAIGLVAVLALAVLWPSEVWRLAAALLLAAAMGIVQGASFAAIPQLNAADEDRAMASGAVAQLGNLGTTTGTPLLALMISAFGPTGVIWFAAPLCAAGIAVHAFQARRRRPVRP